MTQAILPGTAVCALPSLERGPRDNDTLAAMGDAERARQLAEQLVLALGRAASALTVRQSMEWAAGRISPSAAKTTRAQYLRHYR